MLCYYRYSHGLTVTVNNVNFAIRPIYQSYRGRRTPDKV